MKGKLKIFKRGNKKFVKLVTSIKTEETTDLFEVIYMDTDSVILRNDK